MRADALRRAKSLMSLMKMAGAQVVPCRGVKPTLGERVFLASGAQVIGNTVLGDDANIWFNAVIRGDCNYIRIGDRTNIQDNVVIHVTNGRHPTLIANDVTVGHSAVIHGCQIAELCLIGMGSVILDGVKVGAESLVAAGAILTPGKEFPPRSMIMGSPARQTRSLSDQEVQYIKQSVQYYLEYREYYRESFLT